MIKTLQKVGIEGTFLNKTKAIYDNPHHTQWGEAESISSKIRSKTRMPTLTTSI